MTRIWTPEEIAQTKALASQLLSTEERIRREAFLAGARYISMLPGPNAVLPPGHAAKAAEDYARKAL